MRYCGWILWSLALATLAGCGEPSSSTIDYKPGIQWPTLWPHKPQVVNPTGPQRQSVPTAPVSGSGDWSVRNPRHWKYIVIHHSATDNGSAATINAAHRARGWDGLGYHFVINNGTGQPDGLVEVGYRWREQKTGAHTGRTPGNEYNASGIGVCMVGDFTDHMPSQAQLANLNRLVSYLMRQYNIPASHVIGHREAPQAATECPGDQFYSYLRGTFRPYLARR